uniref:Uncharacterized protein n=1 Tax=Anguilla anguilla TaxID=7936 RepID=A0A0E9XHS8_ANGAN
MAHRNPINWHGHDMIPLHRADILFHCFDCTCPHDNQVDIGSISALHTPHIHLGTALFSCGYYHDRFFLLLCTERANFQVTQSI